LAGEWVTQLLRQGDAKVLKKYSVMKLSMKREALAKLNRRAKDRPGSDIGTVGAKMDDAWDRAIRDVLYFQEVSGATRRDRTGDLLITKNGHLFQMLH
jgi:hypothetical protein